MPKVTLSKYPSLDSAQDGFLVLMNTRTDSLFAILGLVIVLGVMQHAAFAEYLYWKYWWFDIVMHFLGGAIVAVLYLWFVRFVFPVRDARFSGVAFTLLFTFIVGIMWEVFELAIGVDTEFTGQQKLFDTALDLVMDLSGAILAYATFKRIQHE